MTPKPSKLKPRPLGGDNHPATCVEACIDTTCFSIRQTNDDGTEDLIHFCDWTAMQATIASFLEDRENEP